MADPKRPPAAASSADLAEMAQFPEMNPWPVCRLDRDATVQLANAAARTLFDDKLVGHCWRDVCPGMTEEHWTAILGATSPVVHEADFGDRAFLLTHVPTSSGESVFVFGADITAQRRHERLLAEHAQVLENVARFPEMNPGPVLRLDLDGNVVLANAAARSLFQSDLVGQCWWDLCPAIDQTFWKQTVAGPGTTSVEARIGEGDYILTHRFDPKTSLVFVFGADVTPQKRAERALRQTEKMATLGTMAAGVAHELNNPAAATRRAAGQLAEALDRMEAARAQLGRVSLTDAGLEAIAALDRAARDRAREVPELDPLARASREDELEGWLEERDVPEGWDLSSSLASQGVDRETLDRLAAAVGSEALPAAVAAIAQAFPVYVLLHEIDRGAARVSEIVEAFKGYSYLDQAPIQQVDVHEGLDNTLVILQRKLKSGVTVRRLYAETLPQILACGGELNQVWTNLIDNAADAMDGRGRLTIRTRPDGDGIRVEIEDEGPGIPADSVPRVFDPFFTTKAPGSGMGLGLATCHTIVTEKHGGTIAVESRPGRTIFAVTLPLRPPESAAGAVS